MKRTKEKETVGNRWEKDEKVGTHMVAKPLVV